VNAEERILTQQQCLNATSPCLAVAWGHDEAQVLTGCTDGSIKSFDLATEKASVVGYHDGPVKDLYWLAEANFLLSLSFDKTLRFWDPRQGGHVAGFQLDYKSFCSDLVWPYLAVGMSEEKLLIMNLNEVQNVLGSGRTVEYLKSPVVSKLQMNCVRLMKGDELGVAVSAVDGRCALSTVTENLNELKNDMNFKIHRVDKEKNGQLMYPMNTVSFHPGHKTWDFICTGGGDGKMFFMDMKKKNRIVDFDFHGVPVTQTRFDQSGRFLAYSLGYDWARGVSGYMSQPSKICVHVMQEKERFWRYQGDNNYPIKYE